MAASAICSSSLAVDRIGPENNTRKSKVEAAAAAAAAVVAAVTKEEERAVKAMTHRRSKKSKDSSRSSSRGIAHPVDKAAVVAAAAAAEDSTATANTVSCLDSLVIKDASARKDRVAIVEIFIPTEDSGSYGAFNTVIKKLQKLDPHVVVVAYHLPPCHSSPEFLTSPYSRRKFAKRQSAYTRAFDAKSGPAPQMVVQGCKLRSYQYCDQNTAVQEAARALHSTRPKVVVGFEVMELCTDQRNVKALLRVNVKVIEDTEPINGFIVTAMLTENRLPLGGCLKTRSTSLASTSSSHRSGEPRHHYAVVRALKERHIDHTLVACDGALDNRPTQGESISCHHQVEQATLAIQLRTDALETESPIAIDRCRIVVTVQSAQSRRVLGVNSLPLTTMTSERRLRDCTELPRQREPRNKPDRSIG